MIGLGAGRYLELLAPNPDDGEGAAVVAAFAEYRALTPVGWAIRSLDLESVLARASRNGLPGGSVTPGARRRPDGTTLRWRTLIPWGTPSGLLPFFIEWDRAGPHPSAEVPAGCQLAGFALSSPAADALTAMLRGAGVAITVAPAAREEMAVTLACEQGRVEFRRSVPVS